MFVLIAILLSTSYMSVSAQSYDGLLPVGTGFQAIPVIGQDEKGNLHASMLMSFAAVGFVSEGQWAIATPDFSEQCVGSGIVECTKSTKEGSYFYKMEVQGGKWGASLPVCSAIESGGAVLNLLLFNSKNGMNGTFTVMTNDHKYTLKGEVPFTFLDGWNMCNTTTFPKPIRSKDLNSTKNTTLYGVAYQRLEVSGSFGHTETPKGNLTLLFSPPHVMGESGWILEYESKGELNFCLGYLQPYCVINSTESQTTFGFELGNWGGFWDLGAYDLCTGFFGDDAYLHIVTKVNGGDDVVGKVIVHSGSIFSMEATLPSTDLGFADCYSTVP